MQAIGSAWVTGTTNSPDFLVLNAAQPTFGGQILGLSNAFVARLNAAGALQFSTCLGGTSGAVGEGITVDASGNATQASAGPPFFITGK